MDTFHAVVNGEPSMLVVVSPEDDLDVIVRNDLEQRRISRDLVKDNCYDIFHKKPPNSCKRGKRL